MYCKFNLMVTNKGATKLNKLQGLWMLQAINLKLLPPFSINCMLLQLHASECLQLKFLFLHYLSAISGGKKFESAEMTTTMSEAYGAIEIGIFLSRICQFLIRSISRST